MSPSKEVTDLVILPSSYFGFLDLFSSQDLRVDKVGDGKSLLYKLRNCGSHLGVQENLFTLYDFQPLGRVILLLDIL